MDINQYPIQDIFEELDDNNREMVNRLMEAFPVEFRVWQNKCYSAILKTIGVPSSKIVILYYPPISQEKIAHELLHMFCQLSLGTNECILSSPDEEDIYKKVFTEQFCEWLLNNAEHILMYPYYKDMGYDPNHFFEAFDDPGNIVAEFKQRGIRNHGSKYSLAMVVNYLKLCIHLQAFPLDNSCQKYLKEIKQIEYPLFSAVSRFFKGIEDIEISANNYDYIQDKYIELRKTIVSWINRNRNNLVVDF